MYILPIFSEHQIMHNIFYDNDRDMHSTLFFPWQRRRFSDHDFNYMIRRDLGKITIIHQNTIVNRPR